MIGRTMLAAIGISLVTACATPTLFEWGNYENSLYAYYKRPEGRPAYEKALNVAIERGVKSKRLAPGLYAERGFLHLENGNDKEARVDFEREMASFPESRIFLSGVIERMGATVPSQSEIPTTTAAGS